MKIRRSLKYISNRVFALLLTVWIGLAGTACIQFILTLRKEASLGAAIVTAALAFAFLPAAWFGVIVPYRRSEKRIAHFTEGYIFAEGAESEQAVLTPSVEKQMQAVAQILRSPQRIDLNKRQAQYLALQNQINPHFLYNTLESIRGEALIAGLDSVADMTEALARFFRYTITKVENLVSVEEELDNCQTYFGIQKYRFGDRLNLHIEYDPEEADTIMNCRIPKLTLQPVLENGIIHGTELKIGAGNLYIRFECTQDRLIIRICDDGVGMDEETLARLNHKLGKSPDAFASEETRGGIALENVNNRIHLLFGDEYGMHVYSVQGSGTDVEITLPVTSGDWQVRNRSVLR